MLRKAGRRILEKLNEIIVKLDDFPWWWLGFLIMLINFTPYFVMGEGSVFEIHDQLDECMMNNVLTARHLGEGLSVLPEMMGGINSGGLQPAAILFVPLYRIMPEFWAFILQYAVCFAAGFFGMYLCVKELMGSSVLAAMTAGCFCMLPMYPVYGLSEMGIPLIFFAFLRLWKGRKPGISLLIIVFFGLTSHLVYTGYVVLSLWAVALLAAFVRRRPCKWTAIGFLLLAALYIAENYNLFWEILFSQSTFTSHRTEMVSYAMSFWDAAKAMFVESGQHSPSLHRYLILPIVILLVCEGVCWRRMDACGRRRYLMALGGLAFLAGIALFYGVCKSPAVTAWKNSLTGFLRYFQIERYYWLYPAGWYLEFACAAGVWWRRESAPAGIRFWRWPVFRLLVLGLLLLPTLLYIKVNCYFYLSVNQINNGSGITGYISWESFYAEDLMQELEETIGRDITTYRVAHLGMSPAPALMHGFYTVDGYSNNYSLEYKHRFRRVIARELEKNEGTRLYFDEWGNRCYLFNGATGNAWMLGKREHIVYEKLEFDMGALRELGCEYIFSCGEIGNARELGLSLLGYYETESSFWGVWLYELGSNSN